jgi:N-methylhydantoinase A/oxoprolinase/acetone carboxylase beta subunit
MTTNRTFRVGVDIGGTFTDIVCLDRDGKLFTKKVEHHHLQTFVAYARDIDPVRLEQAFTRLESEALETLAAEGYGRERVEVRHCVDLGYLRQNSELAIPLQATLLTPRHLQQLAEDCRAKHEQTYGDHSPQETVQIVNIRVVARGLDLALSHRRPDVVGEGADVRWVICVLAGDQPLVVAPTGSPDVPFALLPQVVDVHA